MSWLCRLVYNHPDGIMLFRWLRKTHHKSMAICSHFHSRISNTFNDPYSLWCSTLTSWHIIHFLTKRPIPFSHSSTKIYREGLDIFFYHLDVQCMGVEWAFLNISFLIPSPFSTQPPFNYFDKLWSWNNLWLRNNCDQLIWKIETVK